MKNRFIFIVVLFLCSLSNIRAQTLYDVFWIDTIGIQVDTNQKSIIKVTSSGWNSSGGNSYSILPGSSTNGAFKFSINNDYLSKAIGFTSKSTPVNVDQIEFCFYFSGNNYYIYDHGILIGWFGNYSAGDEFKIERIANDIDFYVNGILVHNIFSSTNLDFHVGSAIYDIGAGFDNVETDFGQPRIKLITKNDASIFNTGIIEIDVEGQFPPYSVEWNDLSIASINSRLSTINATIPNAPLGLTSPVLNGIDLKLRSQLNSGSYEVTVTDANGAIREETYAINIKSPYFFEDSILKDTVLNSLTNVGNSNDWKNVTNRVLINQSTDFSFGFSLPNSGSEITLGIRDTSKLPDDSLKNMALGFHFDGTQINIWDGTSYTSTYGAYTTTDEFEINSVAGNLSFSKNGVQLKTSPIPASTDFTLDMSLHGAFASVKETHIFNNGNGVYAPNTEIKHTSCNGEDGCISPILDPNNWYLYPHLNFPNITMYWLYFEWTDVKTGKIISNNLNICGLAAGQYELAVKYGGAINGGVLFKKKFEVGSKVAWDWHPAAKSFITKTNDDLEKISGSYNSSYNQLISKNVITTQESGWVEADFEVSASGFASLGLVQDRIFSPRKDGFSTLSIYNFNSPPSVRDVFHASDFRGRPAPLFGKTPWQNYNFSLLKTYTSVPSSKTYKVKLTRHVDVNGVYIWLATIDGVWVQWPIDFSWTPGANLSTNYLNSDANLYIAANIVGDGNKIKNIITSFPCEVVDSYNVLENKLKGDYRDTYGETFYFKYDAEYNDGTLKFKILKESDRSSVSGYNINKSLKEFGDNRYAIDMGLLPNDKYILEVTNEKNETYYLRIKKEL